MSQEEMILREPEVRRITGLSRSTRWRMIRSRKFPAPVLLGASAVGWIKSEIQQWIQDRLVERE